MATATLSALVFTKIRSLAAVAIAGAVGAWLLRLSSVLPGARARPLPSRKGLAHSRPMQFVGHRGASAIAPENTLKAVQIALEQGMGFEVDLQLTRDGQVIVLHDDTLSRTAAISWPSSRRGSAALRRP